MELKDEPGALRSEHKSESTHSSLQHQPEKRKESLESDRQRPAGVESKHTPRQSEPRRAESLPRERIGSAHYLPGGRSESVHKESQSPGQNPRGSKMEQKSRESKDEAKRPPSDGGSENTSLSSPKPPKEQEGPQGKQQLPAKMRKQESTTRITGLLKAAPQTKEARSRTRKDERRQQQIEIARTMRELNRSQKEKAGNKVFTMETLNKDVQKNILTGKMSMPVDREGEGPSSAQPGVKSEQRPKTRAKLPDQQRSLTKQPSGGEPEVIELQSSTERKSSCPTLDPSREVRPVPWNLKRVESDDSSII